MGPPLLVAWKDAATIGYVGGGGRVLGRRFVG